MEIDRDDCKCGARNLATRILHRAKQFGGTLSGIDIDDLRKLLLTSQRGSADAQVDLAHVGGRAWMQPSIVTSSSLQWS